MESYKEIADNLRGEIRSDWVDKIAAADDLLAVIPKLLAALDIAMERSEGDTFGKAHNSTMDAIADAEAAIAKA